MYLEIGLSVSGFRVDVVLMSKFVLRLACFKPVGVRAIQVRDLRYEKQGAAQRPVLS